MRFMKLLDWPHAHIGLGTSLEFPGGGRFDDQVIRCILCQAFRYKVGYEIYIISGEYAGHYVGLVPSSALTSSRGPLPKEWLVKNWAEHFGHLCEINSVHISVDAL